MLPYNCIGWKRNENIYSHLWHHNNITTFYSRTSGLEYNAYQWTEIICILTFPFVGAWRYHRPIGVGQSITMTCFWGHFKLLSHGIEFCFAYCLSSAVKGKLIRSVIGLNTRSLTYSVTIHTKHIWITLPDESQDFALPLIASIIWSTGQMFDVSLVSCPPREHYIQGKIVKSGRRLLSADVDDRTNFSLHVHVPVTVSECESTVTAVQIKREIHRPEAMMKMTSLWVKSFNRDIINLTVALFVLVLSNTAIQLN